MKSATTFALRPGESLNAINTRLANFYAADYERGTLEVHPQRASHHITLRLKDAELPYRTVPGTRQTWNEDYFPDVVRFVTDRPYRTNEFPTDAFTLNGVGIDGGSVRVTDQYSFEVWLTGNTGNLLSGDNALAMTDTVYGQRGGEIKGTVWNGERAPDLLPRRGNDPFYRQLGGRLKLECLTLHKSETPQGRLNKFTRRRSVTVLDYVFETAADQASISGWMYIIYVDNDAFTIDFIDPGPDAVVQGTGSSINIKFNTEIDPGYTSDFQDRVFTTNYGETGLIPATGASFNLTRDQVTITPGTGAQTEGLHQLYVNLEGVRTVDGQSFVAPSNDVWSTYYIRDITLPRNFGELNDVNTGGVVDGQTMIWDSSSGSWGPGAGGGGGSGTGTGGAPTNGPYVTYASDANLTNERVTAGGTYIDITNDGSNLTFEADTGALNTVFPDQDQYDYLSGEVTTNAGNITTNTTDIGTNQTSINTNLATLTGHTGDLNNPHQVTAGDVGAPTIADYDYLSGEVNTNAGNITTNAGDITTNAGNITNVNGILTGHTGDLGNPHQVTPTQIGAPSDADYDYLSGQVATNVTDIGTNATDISNVNTSFTGHTGDSLYHFLKGDVNLNDLGDVNVPTPSDGEALVYNGSEWTPVTVETGGSGAPVGATYVTITTNTTLTSERTLNPGTYMDLTDAGAGNNVTLDADTGALAGVFTLGADFTGHTGATNPHNVTAADVGSPTTANYDYLSGQVNTNATDISTNVGDITTNLATLTGHTGDQNNPHNVSAADVGAPTLGNYTFLSGQVADNAGDIVNNTTDIGTNQTNITTNLATLTGHTGDLNNPHQVSAADVGSPTTANYDYLSGEVNANATNIGTNATDIGTVNGVLTGHTGDLNNPHAVTASDVGAPTTTDYDYLSGEVNTNVTDIAGNLDKINTNTNLIAANTAAHTGHTGDLSNPHQVTAAQVGSPTTANYDYLSGEVNTNAGNISTNASDIANNTTAFTGHTGDTTFHFLKGDIDLGDLGDVGVGGVSDGDALVYNGSTWAPVAVETGGSGAPVGATYVTLTPNSTLTSERTLTGGTYIDITDGGVGNAVTMDVDTSALDTVFASQAEFNFGYDIMTGHTGNLSNPHGVTASDVGSPTTANYDYLSGELNTHVADNGNPHGVTAAQVGSPTTANYDYLSGEVNTNATDIGTNTTDISTNLATLTGHTGDSSNPHSVTAAQVGAPSDADHTFLSGRVADIEGDVSLNAADIGTTAGNLTYISGELTGHIGDTSNPHSVTAAQVGSPTTANYDYLSGVVNTNSTDINTNLTSIDDNLTTFQGHTGDSANPHDVTLQQAYDDGNGTLDVGSSTLVITGDGTNSVLDVRDESGSIISIRSNLNLIDIDGDYTLRAFGNIAVAGTVDGVNLDDFRNTVFPGHTGDTGNPHATQLDDLQNFTGSPADGEAVVWDAGNSSWGPGTVAGGGADVSGLSGDFTGHTGNYSNPHQTTWGHLYDAGRTFATNDNGPLIITGNTISSTLRFMDTGGDFVAEFDNDGLTMSGDIVMQGSSLIDGVHVSTLAQTVADLQQVRYLTIEGASVTDAERAVKFGRGFRIQDGGANGSYSIELRPATGVSDIEVATQVSVATLVNSGTFISGAMEAAAGAMPAASYRQSLTLSGMTESAMTGTGAVSSFDYLYVVQNTGNLSPGSYLFEVNDPGGSTLSTIDENGAFYAASDIVGGGILSAGGVNIAGGLVDNVDVSELSGDFTGHVGASNPHDIDFQTVWENDPTNFAAPITPWTLTFPGSSRYDNLVFSGQANKIVFGFESRDPYANFSGQVGLYDTVLIGENASLTGVGDIAVNSTLDINSNDIENIAHLSSSGASFERLIDFYSTTPAAGITVGQAWMGNYPAAGVVAWGYGPLAENSYTDVSIVQANNGATVLNCSSIGNSINYTIGGGSLVGGTDIARMSTEGLQTYAGVAATFSGDTTFTAGYDMNIDANIVGDEIISGNHIRPYGQYIAGSRRSGSWTSGQRIRMNFSSTDNMARMTLNSGEVLRITRIDGNYKNGSTAGTWDWEFGFATFQSRTANTVDTYYLVTVNNGDNTNENYNFSVTGTYDSPLLSLTGSLTGGYNGWIPVLGNAGPGTSDSENMCVSLFGYIDKPEA